MKSNLLKPAHLIFPLLLLLACGSEKENKSGGTENVTETIKQLEYEAISAEFRLDTAAIARVMHDSLIAVYPHKLQNRQQELDGIYKGIVSRRKEGETMDSLYLDDFKVQLYDNTAIATFYTVTRGRGKAGPYENRRWRWYDVWVKENGEWKLVALQGTPVNAYQ